MRALPLRVVREESRGMQGVADLTERIDAALQGMRKLARYKELNFKLRVQQGIQKELGQFSVEVTAKPCSCGDILNRSSGHNSASLHRFASTNDWSILSSGAMGDRLHSQSVLLGLYHASMLLSLNQAFSICFFGDRYFQLSDKFP